MVFSLSDRGSSDGRWDGRIRESLAAIAKRRGEALPLGILRLPEGWDRRDGTASLWAAVDSSSFPSGLEELVAEGRKSGLGLALRFDPSGGPGDRSARLALARKDGLDCEGEAIGIAGPRARSHLSRVFAAWAAKGIASVEVDGFVPEAPPARPGAPVVGPATVARIDAVAEASGAWRTANPELVVSYLSGSNPSPLWLAHLDFVAPQGMPTGQAGASGEGEAFDRAATFIDEGLQVHRPTDMPISAFAVEDMPAGVALEASDEAFERNAWWLFARTSLRHSWDLEVLRLSEPRWTQLERAARWARGHERLFRVSRMVGGDPRQGGVYGCAAFESGAGVLALRNPTAKPAALERALSNLLALPRGVSRRTYRLTGVHGDTKALEGVHQGRATLKVELAPLAIVVLEAREEVESQKE
jgi:hypothetical protein